MELNDQNQPANSTPTIAPDPPSPIPANTNNNGKLLTIIGISLVILIVGTGAYYLGKHNSKTSTPTHNITLTPTLIPQLTHAIISTNSPVATKTITSSSSIPSDWTLKTNQACNISIPLPPKKEPYLEHQGDLTIYWKYQEGPGSHIFDLSFDNLVAANYFTDQGLGSGYVAGLVSINCSNNIQNHTTTSYADFISNSVKKRDMYMGEKSSCQPTQNNLTMWNKNIVVIDSNCKIIDHPQQTIRQDKYYVFATKTLTYLIENISDANKPFIKQTADNIFTNLQFMNNK